MLNKKILTFIFVLLAAAGLVVFAVYSYITRIPIIAFYDIPPEQTEAVQTFIKTAQPDAEKKFYWKTVPQNVSLPAFLEKNPQTAFVFAYDQIALFDAYERFMPADPSYFQQLPSTLSNNFFTGGENKLYTFPLLIDPVITAYNTDIFRQLNLPPPDTLETFEAALQQLKADDRFPLICAGGNDTQLFFLISAVQAMLNSGTQSEVFTPLRESQRLQTIPPELKTVLQKLIEWKSQGYLHPEWFRLVESDVSLFMQYGKAGIVCMPLSENRRIDAEINGMFTPIHLPLPPALSQKNMPADVLVYARTAGSAENKAANMLQALLSQQDTNETLAKSTGLAPVFSSALTQDGTASSGRYWVASSQKALPSFGNTAAYTAEEKAALAKAVREYLQVNGLGY